MSRGSGDGHILEARSILAVVLKPSWIYLELSAPGGCEVIYAFGDIELDLDRFELRRANEAVPVEPQVFSLLTLLIENHERMVSRDEIIERVWNGRIVSEAAISSRIKAARRAVGDDGDRQEIIKTVHGRGFRCVALVRILAVPAVAAASPRSAPAETHGFGEAGASPSMPSIAILPFAAEGTAGNFSALSEALPHEVINALSRLRWLKVIARGSSFRFREQNPDIAAVGMALGARYCLTGFLQMDDGRIATSVELAETEGAQVIWSETFFGTIHEIPLLRAGVVAGVVAALETHVPMNEARAARVTSPENLDAWAIYHLGIQRMFRFSSQDNAAAAEYFREAIRREPGMARAHAGLSFTQFQNAYHGFSRERERSAAEAHDYAEQAVALDPLDPFANFTLGRAHWLEGDMFESLGWLDRATALSPSYAQCVYARGFADTMLGNTAAAQASLRRAIELSPLDPFLYAMKGTLGITYLIERNVPEAISWLDQAARTPGSPPVVPLVTAAAHGLGGDMAGTRQWVRRARQQDPQITLDQFKKATPMADAELLGEMIRLLTECWE